MKSYSLQEVRDAVASTPGGDKDRLLCMVLFDLFGEDENGALVLRPSYPENCRVKVAVMTLLDAFWPDVVINDEDQKRADDLLALAEHYGIKEDHFAGPVRYRGAGDAIVEGGMESQIKYLLGFYSPKELADSIIESGEHPDHEPWSRD